MGNASDIEGDSILQPTDALSLQDEKRKERRKKTNTFKKHHSDSDLNIITLQELDKELQSVAPSQVETEKTVSYRLKGLHSEGSEDKGRLKRRGTGLNENKCTMQKICIDGQSLKEQVKDIRGEQEEQRTKLLRNTLSVSPSRMARMKTPVFDLSFDGDGALGEEQHSSPSSFSPLKFSPTHKMAQDSSNNNMGRSASSANTIHSISGEIIVPRQSPEEKKSDESIIQDCDIKNKNSLSNSNSNSNNKLAVFSSSASLELLVLHKSQGSGNESKKVAEAQAQLHIDEGVCSRVTETDRENEPAELFEEQSTEQLSVELC